jgi:hypothetical protein
VSNSDDVGPIEHTNMNSYERYLNMDDNEAFDHLQNIGSEAPDLTHFVQSLITEQLNGTWPLNYSAA